jgi:peptide/nickel transport system substrate-binding protein
MDTNRVAGLLDDLNRGKISRRDFLRIAAGLGVSVPAAAGLLQACAPTPEASPTTAPSQPTSAPTTAPAAPTATSAPARTSMTVGKGKEPISFNPFAIGSFGDLDIITTICDSLFEVDYSTMTLLPILVEDWEQADALTWNFKLKEGIQFHQGWGEMTAEDYAFWANTIIAEKPIPYFLFGSGKVKGVTVTDKYAFEVQLNEPWAPFPVMSLVTFGGIVFSKKAFEEMGAEQFAMNPIGCGPFELDSWAPGGDMVLKKYEDYHDPAYPGLEEIRFTGVPDSVVRLEKLRAGEIHYTTGLDYKDVPSMEEDPGINVMWHQGFNWDHIGFNLKLEDRPWLIKEVRQAIAYAVDRQQIVDTIYYGGATPEDDPLPAGYIGADPDHKYYPDTADVDKAKELLAQAGYPDGFTMPCLTDERENLRQEIQLVANQLSQVGITLEIEISDRATASTRTMNGEFETALGWHGLASADSDSALLWYRPASFNSQGYDNPDVEALLVQAGEELDRDKREPLYHQAVELISEDCPKVTLCNVNQLYTLNADLGGFVAQPNQGFPYFKTIYWTS